MNKYIVFKNKSYQVAEGEHQFHPMRPIVGEFHRHPELRSTKFHCSTIYLD